MWGVALHLEKEKVSGLMISRTMGVGFPVSKSLFAGVFKKMWRKVVTMPRLDKGLSALVSCRKLG